MLAAMHADQRFGDAQPIRIDPEGDEDRQAGTMVLHGALVWQSADPDGEPDEVQRLHVVPFGARYDGKDYPEPVMHLVYSTQAPRPDVRAGVAVTETDTHAWRPPGFPEQEGSMLMDLLALQAQVLGSTVLSALYLLEASRVRVVEASLSTKQAKIARRRGQTPTWTVAIAPVQIRESPCGSTGQYKVTSRYSVRGHYAYYRPTTKIGGADPEKLSWVPERGGYFRKVWRAPHIRGPEGAPLARRVRRYRA